ncbi:MAG: cytosol nonspecific dipeptidase [Ignavibacteria bacterium CG22_combo_CG10-13_8_21_14_all_37_15]|nr:MAG: cytosol nonspecific dipeptidase [Ignavibacteria bacterium CG22_combo_CG10-13_8_21_14_all_37_15]
MGTVLAQLKPALVWKYFEEISQHPRPSKHEEKVAAYIFSVGKKLNLETVKDAFGNIIIRKPATAGKENLKTVVLQGHLDMVCEKNRDVEHDFDNDPLQVYIDGDFVKANGTTLGADNGIGVASALAVLEDSSIQHGPLECLFTLDEETGLTGAASLDPSILKADILLNLDSEELGTFFIGCSGGKNTSAKFTFTPENVPADSVSYEIKVAGLQGGHSGLEIQTGRGNAVKILNRFLWNATTKLSIRLAQIEGGNKHNAIPREAFAVVTVPKAKEADFLSSLANYNKTIKEELATNEPNLIVSAAVFNTPSNIMDEKTTDQLLNALYAVPHGVITMSPDIAGLVETSTNLATIITEGNNVNIVTSQRSSVASENQDIVDMVHSVFDLAGAEISHGDGYPGWKPNVHSEILKVFKSVYKEMNGKEPEVAAIHAGLECGIIGEKYPKMDMISFGPTMFGVHSPDERLMISSVQPFYDLLANVLKNIPAK